METGPPKTTEPSAPSLGICIPTYNRRELLSECLRSLLPQCHERGVRVYISDNGSTDGTVELVEEIRRTEFPEIELHRNATNLGFGWNLRAAIALAKTDYIWLLSDDDVIVPGAVRTVLERLSSRPGLVVVNSWKCVDGLRSTGKRFYRWRADTQLAPGEHDALLVALSTGPAGSLAFLSQYIVDRRLLDLTGPLRSRDFEQIPLLFSGVVGRTATLVAAPQVLCRSRSEVQSPEQRERPFRSIEIWFRNWQEAVSMVDSRYGLTARMRALRLPMLQTIRVVVNSRSRGPLTRDLWEYAIRQRGIERSKRAALLLGCTIPRGVCSLLVPLGRSLM